MKTCTRCGINPQQTNHHWCTSCKRTYYQEYYKPRKTEYLDRERKYRKTRQEFLRKAKDNPCSDCGEQYPYYVMDLDHISNKSFNLSGRGTYRMSLDKLQSEIDKCELVCSNCHRIRTHRRASVNG